MREKSYHGREKMKKKVLMEFYSMEDGKFCQNFSWEWFLHSHLHYHVLLTWRKKERRTNFLSSSVFIQIPCCLHFAFSLLFFPYHNNISELFCYFENIFLSFHLSEQRRGKYIRVTTDNKLQLERLEVISPIIIIFRFFYMRIVNIPKAFRLWFYFQEDHFIWNWIYLLILSSFGCYN